MLKYFSLNVKKNSSLFVNKAQILSKNKQQGFTLVTVLILSSLASILVLNSLKDNVNQERLSGNFQKKINSRLASERGIFDSIAAARTFLAANQGATTADLVANLGTQTGGTNLTHGGMSYNVTLSETTPGELILSSTGNRFEGQSALKVRLKIVPGGSSRLPFSDAVVGCEGINLSGSGQVDSYNSKNAVYDANNPGHEGNISTIDENGANVILGGNSPILGDVSSTGEIHTKSSDVDGNLHANGNIIIGSSGVKLRVSGNVLTRGNYYQNGGKIGGHVRANGDAYMTWNNFILNNTNNGLDILYGGSPDFKDTRNNKRYERNQYRVFPDVAKVKDSDASAPDYDPTDAGTNCDNLGIENVVDSVDNGSDGLAAFNSQSSGVSYTIERINGGLSKMYRRVSSPIFTSISADVLGNHIPVIKLKEFNLKGSDQILIKGGAVTLFVEGDFKMAGATKITIAEGSSLTLIMKGAVELGAGAGIIALQHGLANSGLPAMSIYSSYNGLGINLSGDFELYAAIYAPLSDIKISGSGTLYGSVRGKTVTVTGGAAIHYDAALGYGGGGEGNDSHSSQASLAFLGWQY